MSRNREKIAIICHFSLNLIKILKYIFTIYKFEEQLYTIYEAALDTFEF